MVESLGGQSEASTTRFLLNLSWPNRTHSTSFFHGHQHVTRSATAPLLGVKETRARILSARPEEVSQAGRYRSTLAERRVLIVLDNAADSELVLRCRLVRWDAW